VHDDDVAAEASRHLDAVADGFDFCPEVTALVRRRGIRIHEVPVEYAARTRAEGKKVRWKHGFQALKTLILCRFRNPWARPERANPSDPPD